MRACTRRQWLRGAAGAGLGVLAAGRLGPAFAAAPPPMARVAVARDPAAVDAAGNVQPAVVERLVARAVADAFGARDAAEALRSVVSPTDIVGLKVNCIAGRALSTHLALVHALAGLLSRIGVPPSHVVVWDRTSDDLRRAGYPVGADASGLRFRGTDTAYEREPVEAGSVGTCFSRILTEACTKQINLPVLKDHDLAGVSGGLKNFYGAMHNPNKYHDNGCSPYIAEVCAHPAVRTKCVLTVLDVLRPQYHGGPVYNGRYCWPEGAVAASTDPVALDHFGWQRIETERQSRGLPSLTEAKRAPAWLAVAARLGLGTADPQRIRIVRS